MSTSTPTLTELIERTSAGYAGALEDDDDGTRARNLATCLGILLDKRASHEGIASRGWKRPDADQ